MGPAAWRPGRSGLRRAQVLFGFAEVFLVIYHFLLLYIHIYIYIDIHIIYVLVLCYAFPVILPQACTSQLGRNRAITYNV